MSSKKKLFPEEQREYALNLALSLNLPLGGVDTHAHLDDVQYAYDLEQVLAGAYAAGVAYIGNVFLSVADWQAEKQGLSLRYKFSTHFFSAGCSS